MQTKQNSKQEKPKETLETATLAGGCFWCIESDLEKIKGVKEVISGYTGGDKSNPSYKEVSSGSTGHLEAVQIFFNPKEVSYSDILDVFWRKINPLDEGGQFVDRGKQYSSAIFYHNAEQKTKAEQSKKELEQKGPFKETIVTPILAFKKFYKAEDYHQDYYKKNPLKYNFYRYRSGRDQFLKKTWGSAKKSQSSQPQEVNKKEDQTQQKYIKPPLEEIKKSSALYNIKSHKKKEQSLLLKINTGIIKKRVFM